MIHESRLPQTSLRGAKRRGNLMLLARNDEITTLFSIARDDNFILSIGRQIGSPEG